MTTNRVDRTIEALADPTRRRVFERLAEGPASVGEIAARLPVTRPAVSQHLRTLKEAGLIGVDKVGTRNIYKIEPDGLAELRDYLDRFWQSSLATFKRAVEDEEAGR
ncbi:MAG TPA: metalloregulator ArsR/SmtB family transcription factor [Solirubrobacterales bacterium]|nr:metalloregulator ArsR/SmtB family transcription factor [Solirubrobacterales bacterium]